MTCSLPSYPEPMLYFLHLVILIKCDIHTLYAYSMEWVTCNKQWNSLIPTKTNTGILDDTSHASIAYRKRLRPQRTLLRN